MKAKLIMVGERRSGTNLLRLMLSQNPEIVAPHMVALLDKLMPLTRYYGPSTGEETLRQMIEDAIRVIKQVPVEWRGPELTVDSIAKRCNMHTFTSILNSIMEQCREHANAKVWIAKEPRGVQWRTEIADDIGEVGYIYLYRDPRDVVLSFANIADGENHPYAIAKHWTEIQELCLASFEKLPTDWVHWIRYEDLVTHPGRILSELCKFIGVPYSNRMLEFHRRDEAAVTSASNGAHWANLSRPVSSASINKYLKHLPVEHVQMVEFVAGDAMRYLGYLPSVVPRLFSESEIRSFLERNELEKEKVLSEGKLPHLKERAAFFDEIRTRKEKT